MTRITVLTKADIIGSNPLQTTDNMNQLVFIANDVGDVNQF
jgi:hypothetical protein